MQSVTYAEIMSQKGNVHIFYISDNDQGVWCGQPGLEVYLTPQQQARAWESVWTQ